MNWVQVEINYEDCIQEILFHIFQYSFFEKNPFLTFEVSKPTYLCLHFC